MNDLNRGAGDPDGRRIARRRAIAAEEACRVAEWLAILMRGCGVPDTDARGIATTLRLTAKELMEKAHGRVESRLPTKKTGHPLLEGRPVNCLFLDESGTSVLGASDGVFALGGVAIQNQAITTYVAQADELKREFFGRTDITLHEPKMRQHRDHFDFRGDRRRQAKFDAALRGLIEATPFTVFGVGIRKQKFQQDYVNTNTDPYLPTRVYDLAIMLLLERYVDFLGSATQRQIGRVHLESIGAREDAAHQAAYADLLLNGTQFVPEGSFQSWVEAGCRFSPKAGSSPAELCDLVAREVFEWTREDCASDPPYWDILSPRIYCRADGLFGKFGIKVFPAEDIEEAVMAHRERCGATPRN